MKLFKTLTICLFLLSGLTTSAQDVQRLTLDQAVQYALSNSAEMKNAKLDVQVSEQEVKSVISTGLPQLTASANFTHNPQIAAMQLPDFISPAVYGVLVSEGLLTPDRFKSGSPQTVQFGAPSSLTGMVNLSQLVFDGTYFLGLKAAKQYVRVSELLEENKRIEVIEAVQKAFYGAMITEQNATLVDKSLKQINQSYNETVELKKAGYAEELDVDRLLLAKSSLETRASNLKMQREIMLQVLKVTMGMDINKPLVLEGNLDDYLTTLTVQDTDVKVRSEYQILKQKMLLDSLNVKRYKVGYMPSLTLNASYQQNSFANEAEFKGLGQTWNPGTSYGLNLSIPIFDGFYKQSKISQAKLELEKDRNTLNHTVNALLFEAEQAKLNLRMQEMTLANQKTTRELANRIYNTTLTKFNAGVATSFELVQAENDKTTAEIDYSNALYQMLLAQIQYNKTLGNLKSK